jgi:hypothetical protein
MVGRGFLDAYQTFREESTKGNFQVADNSPPAPRAYLG